MVSVMVITELKKKRGRLFQLVLDGEPAVNVDVRVFEESPYKVGSSLSDEQLKELIDLSSQRRSREKALYLLSLRDHSRKELEMKLSRDTDYATASATAERMEELGLINDQNFAKHRARDMISRKYYPARRTVQELCALGISRDTAQEAVDSLECNDAQQALALLKKKYYNRNTDEVNIRKTAAALARYGFDGSAVRYAINEWKSEEQDLEFDD